MATKAKFDETTRSFLKAAYVEAVEDHGGAAKVTAEFNKLFFARMRKTEVLAEFTEAQMRGSLIIADVYVATAPRQAPKKAGRCKAELLADFTRLSGVRLGSGMKLTMMDIETLTEAFQVAHGINEANEENAMVDAETEIDAGVPQ